MDIIRLALRRPIFVTMITVFLIALGVLSLRRLPVDLYPEFSYPVLVVRTSLPGAAPEEVEQLITKRLEDTLSTVAGVKTMRSISREGGANIIMEFDIGDDIRHQEIQVRAKIANARRSLPDDMDEPLVFRQDPDDAPIIELSLTGPRTSSELTRIAEDDVATRLRQIPGVGEVTLEGEREEEIQVELDPLRLEAWRIDARSVVTAIRAFNRNDPAGKLQGEGRVWLLRSLSQAKDVLALGEIVVGKTGDGRPVFLRDVARLSAGFAEVRRVSRAGTAQGSTSAVLINILKQSGENTVAVSSRVQSVLGTLTQSLPAGIQLQTIRDNADLVRTNVDDVKESLIIGGILTVLVVLIFLRSPRSTITTGVALPSSVITTFAIMAVAGFTVNVMTLLALSLAIGLLVDDAIVVRENVFRHMTMRQKDPVAAAYDGTREVILAVLATTFVIVAVFLPVAFMGGVTGQFFKQFALTVVFAVLLSTWDALTMAPMLSAYFANITDPGREWNFLGRFGQRVYRLLSDFEHVFDRIAASYKTHLAWMLPRPWVSALVGLSAVGAAALGFALVKKSFLPSQLGPVFSVSLSGPLAVPLDPVLQTAAQVEKRLSEIKALNSWTLRAGPGFSGNASINLTVTVAPSAARSQRTLGEARQQVRQSLGGIPGYSVRISEPADPLAGVAGRFQPLAVMIYGPDIVTIREIARKVRRVMVDTPGVTDVAPIDDEGLPEVRLRPDPGLAAHYGLTPAIVGESLKIWVGGDVSNSLKVGDDQIPIRVRLAGADRLTPKELMTQPLYVTDPVTRKTVAVPLSNFATWDASAGPTVIARENRERAFRIGGNLETGAALGSVVDSLTEGFGALALPNGYRVKISGQNEQMDELFKNVIAAILLGGLFVYMILASLFESFLQPLTVMAAIPLAGIGAVGALLLFGMPLDLYGGIGMILLAGIVAKNSILLVDFAMQRVREQEEARGSEVKPVSAILETAPLRLRPIIMTSVAMIAGMIPVASGLGAGGAARMSLGIATIGGVITSTLLTLYVVPNIFLVMEKVRSLSRTRK